MEPHTPVTIISLPEMHYKGLVIVLTALKGKYTAFLVLHLLLGKSHDLCDPVSCVKRQRVWKWAYLLHCIQCRMEDILSIPPATHSARTKGNPTARLACLHISTTWSLCLGFMVKVLLHTRFFSLFFLIAQRVCSGPLFALRVEERTWALKAAVLGG